MISHVRCGAQVSAEWCGRGDDDVVLSITARPRRDQHITRDVSSDGQMTFISKKYKRIINYTMLSTKHPFNTHNTPKMSISDTNKNTR